MQSVQHRKWLMRFSCLPFALIRLHQYMHDSTTFNYLHFKLTAKQWRHSLVFVRISRTAHQVSLLCCNLNTSPLWFWANGYTQTCCVFSDISARCTGVSQRTNSINFVYYVYYQSASVLSTEKVKFSVHTSRIELTTRRSWNRKIVLPHRYRHRWQQRFPRL